MAARIQYRPCWSATSTSSRSRDPGKATRLAAAAGGGVEPNSGCPASPMPRRNGRRWTRPATRAVTDTSYALYRIEFAGDPRARAGEAKFVILSGDLIAHMLHLQICRGISESGAGRLRRFVRRQSNTLWPAACRAFPGVPVYAALGNNDSDCGDYQLDANSAFLPRLGKVITADFTGRKSARACEDFAAGGYYSEGCLRRLSKRGCWCWTICLCRADIKPAAARMMRRLRRRKLRG